MPVEVNQTFKTTYWSLKEIYKSKLPLKVKADILESYTYTFIDYKPGHGQFHK